MVRLIGAPVLYLCNGVGRRPWRRDCSSSRGERMGHGRETPIQGEGSSASVDPATLAYAMPRSAGVLGCGGTALARVI